MLIMHNDGQNFSSTATGDIFSVVEGHDGGDYKWWVEQASAYHDVSPVILGKYKTQTRAIEALNDLYDAHVSQLQSFKMP